MKKKVVVIGGGNGTSAVILALKKHLELFDISAVVSMSDSGGATGKLRRELNILPPGDIMRVLLALSSYDYKLIKEIFYKNRFTGCGKLDENNLGNLFVALTERYAGSMTDTITALGQALKTVGNAYPATLDINDLYAELSDGQIIKGEGNLDKPIYDRSLKIKKVWLEPEAKIFDGTKQAIADADYIILPPGGIYTSIIAALLPTGVKEAIAESKAKIIFVCPGMFAASHETGPESYSGMVDALSGYLPRPLDLVIYSNHATNPERAKLYTEKNWQFLDKDFDQVPGIELVLADFEREDPNEPYAVSAIKLGEILKNILV
ncbi:MAG: YvcK family protein [bacterium]|nr:YvcK family protein [bacterium]